MFQEVILELTPALVRAAHYLVSPDRVAQVVQDTWIHAWKIRHTYQSGPQPLTWLHEIMVAVSASSTSGGTAGRRDGDDQRACLEELEYLHTTADLEAFLIADDMDAALSRLDPRQAMIIRRRRLGRQGWYTIAQEMDYRSPLHAWRAYRRATAELGILQDDQPAHIASTPFASGQESTSTPD